MVAARTHRGAFVEHLLYLREHLVGAEACIDFPHQVQLFEVLYDGQRVVVVGVDALFHTLGVVVGTTASGFAAPQASLRADVLRAVEEQHEEDFRLVGHLLVPAIQVVLVARKAVD